MNWKFALVAAAIGLISLADLSAQTTRVAYVDIDRVTEKSEKINKAMGNVSGRVEGIQKEIEEKRKRLAELKLEVKKGQGVMADSVLKTRREEAAKLEKEISDLEYDGRRELQKLDTTLFEPMIKTIVLAIQEVAKERNIDLVVRGEAVIYGADAADITDEVVKKLNSPSFNPDKEPVATSKEKKSADESKSEDSSSPSDKKSSESSESSEAETAAKTSADKGVSKQAPSAKSTGQDIIPNIPLRTRPVDRQSE